MNCLDLFHVPIDEYVANFQAKSDHLFVFQHVPKTAGSSIHVELEKIDNGFHWLGDDTPKNSWDVFELLHDRKPYNVLRGHMKSKHLDLLDQNSIPFVAAGFIRCPVQQTISHFRYCHSEKCPGFEEFRSLYPDVQTFITEYIKPNFTTHYMIGTFESADEAIERIADRFDFVGMTEYYNTSMYIMMSCLEMQFKAKPRVNVTKSNQSVSELLTDQVREQIERDFAIDIAVFNYFKTRYAQLSDRVVEHLTRESTAPASAAPQADSDDGPVLIPFEAAQRLAKSA